MEKLICFCTMNYHHMQVLCLAFQFWVTIKLCPQIHSIGNYYIYYHHTYPYIRANNATISVTGNKNSLIAGMTNLALTLCNITANLYTNIVAHATFPYKACGVAFQRTKLPRNYYLNLAEAIKIKKFEQCAIQSEWSLFDGSISMKGIVAFTSCQSAFITTTQTCQNFSRAPDRQ